MENEILDTELENTENDAPADEEIVDESTVDAPERDDEFEYDEDGNIIIPEPVYDEEDDEDIVIDDAEEEESAEAEPEPVAEEPVHEEAEAPTKNVPDERDAEIERLRRQLENYESQTRDTLSKLGVKSDDALKGLAELAAEADNKSVEDYLKERREAAELENAKKVLKDQAYQKMIAADLAAIHAAYPETKKYASVEEFPNFKRFGELRDKGNTPEEAFAATHSKELAESVAKATRQTSLNDTKSHLKSNVPKKSGGESITMPRKTLIEWRDLFPHMTDKQIIAHYKKTSKL